MENRQFKKSVLIMVIYFVAYLTATIFQSNFWGDILSPLGGLLALSFILDAYFDTNKTYKMQRIWIFFSLACLSWTVADALWAISNYGLYKDPGNNRIISLFYTGTNVFILIATFTYALYRFEKWNGVQLIIDCIVTSVSGLLLLWILFFDRSPVMIKLINSHGWIAMFTIVLDVAVIMGISIWYLSIRDGKIPASIRIISGSTLLFTLADIYWYYLDLRKLYIPNSVIDALYMAALLGIAIGIKLETVQCESPSFHRVAYTNVGLRHRSLCILICPVLVTLLKGFVLMDFFIYLCIVLIYECLNIYVQSAIKNEQLLKAEKKLTASLENKVSVRTKELIEKNRQLDFLSNQDTVTSLYNRRYFIKMLEKRVKQVYVGETLSLLFIDLDRFKIINDTYGHSVGDQVLIKVSKRLQKFNKKNAIVARLGGDEFVIAVHANYDYQETEKFAEQIIKLCNEPIEIGPYSFRPSLSIGISIYPLDAQNSDALMKNADIAMYQAKKRYYNKCVSFNKDLSESIQRKNEIEILLKNADYDKEFMLVYQPQFDVRTKKMVGMEALLRWKGFEKGFISPNEFIPIAEETDQIIPIGVWVMKKAIEQIGRWNEKYESDLKMSINVAPKQFDQTNFMHDLQTSINNFSIDPEWLNVEITEGLPLEDFYRITEIATQFRDIGVSTCVDDYGAGYASLTSLKFLPFDKIKIAKQLINTITNDDYNKRITAFIISLAKTSGIKTIAQGVETRDQFDVLDSIGCEEMQGYFLGRPLPPYKFEETFLRNRIYHDEDLKAMR